NGVLTILNSNVLLNGQGTASHSYNQTDMLSGSRLDIADTLGLAAVTLDRGGTVGARSGWLLDRRNPRRPPGTVIRRAADGGSGAAVWGSITGTLSAQTDLNTALGGKQDLLIGTAVAGQNLKTVNGTTLLGSGDLLIPTGGTGTVTSIAAGTGLHTGNGAI